MAEGGAPDAQQRHHGTVVDAAGATPDWLIEVLHRAGAIGRRRVVAVDTRANQAFNSTVTHLTLTYDREGPGPDRLVLKTNRGGDGEAEVALYQLAMATPAPAMVRCYDAVYDPDSGRSHCLLLDLSDTHEVPVPRERAMVLDGVPTAAQLEAMVDALAAFHGHWWGHAGAIKPPSAFVDPAACAERIARRGEQLARFLADVGKTIDRDTVQLCERALAGLPRLWADRYLKRFADRRDLTIVNGDCYFAQFLCPLEAQQRPIYLIDFQDASVQMPAEDLVFMFATFWTRAQRREGDREMRLLHRYRRRLADQGVNYPLDQLVDDYRVCIVYQLFRTIWDQTSGAAEAYWRPKLSCVVASFQDHACGELFA